MTETLETSEISETFKYKVHKDIDQDRLFSTGDGRYEFLEFMEIIQKCKQHYPVINVHRHPIESCAYQFDFYKHFNHVPNDEEKMIGVLAPAYLYPEFPRFILKQYDVYMKCCTETSAWWECCIKIIKELLNCKTHKIPYNISSLPNNKLTEKSIAYLIKLGEFENEEIIRILLAYKTIYKLIPDRIMNAVTEKHNRITPDIINKYFDPGFLKFSENWDSDDDVSQPDLGYILDLYIKEYDKIKLELDVKSMLLVIKTMREDIKDDSKYYKIPKELMDQLLDHPGFASYAC